MQLKGVYIQDCQIVAQVLFLNGPQSEYSSKLSTCSTGTIINLILYSLSVIVKEIVV
jgi:hypothetical protein